VGKWTTDYKQMLESLVIGGASSAEDAKKESPFIKDFKENHTDTTVKFTVQIPAEKFPEIYHGGGGLAKRFKLESSVTTSNMHLFDTNGMIHKYESPLEILQAFFDVRLGFYEKRKLFLVSKITEEWEKLDNKVRFIMAVIDNKLKVSNRKKKDILNDLVKQGFKVRFFA